LTLLEAGSNVVNGAVKRAFAHRSNPFNRTENQSFWEIHDFCREWLLTIPTLDSVTLNSGTVDENIV